MGIVNYILPFIIFLLCVIILFSKKDYFSFFLRGAKNGLDGAIKLLPSMCALIIGVNMLLASGATEYLADWLAPLFDRIGVPEDIFPLIITRPLSFGASLATFTDIVTRCGVDSYAALCASIIMASTDTVFYVSCVYFSASEIKKTKYFMPVALLVMAVSVFLSCILARIFF